MPLRLVYVSIFKTRGFCVLEIKIGKCSKPLCSAFMFPIVVAQRWALDVTEDQHEKLWGEKKIIKICAESSFAHVNLSVSVVQRVCCIVASCELWHVPVIMHLIWPRTKTFASAFERKGRAAVTGHLSHASPPLEPILWRKNKTKPNNAL